MHRPGTNPDQVQPSDILCDFCSRSWSDDMAMVEGHQGSCICGQCLTVAWHSVIEARQNDAPPQSEEGTWACTMCLEHRKDAAFRSQVREEALICRRCIGLAARALDLDPDHNWARPSQENP